MELTMQSYVNELASYIESLEDQNEQIFNDYKRLLRVWGNKETPSEFEASEDKTFEKFPKIPRLSREIIITEKIDGTNAQILVEEDGTVMAGSRSQWITPENDNHGFAKWVQEHKDELRTGLGVGRHYGEWWGHGINRGYGLKEKRFSLFNTSRWTEENTPSCCSVVPVFWRGIFDTREIDRVLEWLARYGSQAAPGFMRPEGVIIFHVAGRQFFKKTILNDDKPKG